MGEEGIGRRGEREMKRKEKGERREWGEDQYVGVWEGIPIHMQNQRFRQVWSQFRPLSGQVASRGWIYAELAERTDGLPWVDLGVEAGEGARS